ncbi:MAG: LVIVD repeat-containing protein [Anaerolineae bacterium]
MSRASRLAAASQAVALLIVGAFLVAALAPTVDRVGAVYPSAGRGHDAIADDDRLTEVTQIGGTTRAVAVAGEHAYVGVGPRVVVYAVCHPERPVEVGRSAVLGGLVRDVLLVGPYLYVAIGEAGITVLDVRDPSRPEVESTVDLDGVSAGLVALDDRLYVVAGYGGLHILTLATPALPRLVGNYHAVVTDAAVKGTTAYVVARDLMVVDVTDPAAPRQVSALNYWTDAVATDGLHLYAAVSSDVGGGHRRGQLEVYDVSDPNPRRSKLIARLDIGIQARSVTYLPGELAVYGAARFLTVDVTTPSAPRVTQAFDTYDEVADLAVARPYLYLAAAGAGLRVLDLRGGQAASEVADVRPLALAHAVAAADGVVFVEDEGHVNRLLVLDVTRPTAPRHLASLPLAVANEALLARDGVLYVGTTDETVRLYEVSAPAHPRLISEIAMPDAVWDLDVEGDFAYVANGDYLRIVDLRNADRPYEIGSVRTSGGATGVAVSQGFAYVTGPTTGIDMSRRSLQVIDVRDPFEPREVGVMPDAAGWKHGIAAAGILVYVDGLQVVDVTDPRHPVEAARLSTAGETSDIVLSGQIIYAGKGLREGGGEVHVFDVSAPSAPQQVALKSVLEPVHDLAEWRGRIFVAAEEAGLIVLEDRETASALPTPEPPPSLQWPEALYLPAALRGPLGPPCR